MFSEINPRGPNYSTINMLKSIHIMYQEGGAEWQKPKGVQVVLTDSGSTNIQEALTHLASASNLINALTQNKLK